MMVKTRYDLLSKALTLFFSMIWMVNGLFCKILNLVPRHQEIVAQILGKTYSRELTILIGIAEIFMAIWILSRRFSRLCAITQIVVIGTMNILEFFLVPDLLLWGKMNLIFALGLMLLIYYQAFILKAAIKIR